MRQAEEAAAISEDRFPTGWSKSRRTILKRPRWHHHQRCSPKLSRSRLPTCDSLTTSRSVLNWRRNAGSAGLLVSITCHRGRH